MNAYEKMREALSDACYAMFNFLKTQNGGYEEIANALDKAKSALAEPRRNCDVGTAEEQDDRYVQFCYSHSKNNGNCLGCAVLKLKGRCEFAWEQLPYDEGGAK